MICIIHSDGEAKQTSVQEALRDLFEETYQGDGYPFETVEEAYEYYLDNMDDECAVFQGEGKNAVTMFTFLEDELKYIFAAQYKKGAEAPFSTLNFLVDR